MSTGALGAQLIQADTHLSLSANVSNAEETALRIRDAFRAEVGGLERYASGVQGSRARLTFTYPDFDTRAVAFDTLNKKGLQHSFIFASGKLDTCTIECEVSGTLTETLNEVAAILSVHDAQAYFENAGGAAAVRKTAEDDVMRAFSQWIGGRLGGHIQPSEL